MKNVSSFLQFLMGFALGVALLVGGTAALGYIVLSRMASPPEKPLFAEEKPQTPAKETEKIENPSPVAASSPEPFSPSPEVSAPSGSYTARVNWPQGLSLREGPSASSTRIGGVDFNTKVLILSTNEDGQWQKIRVIGTEQEGWIKAGNVDKIQE